MVTKGYDWENGAPLAPHTKKKHQILKNYFLKYLETRCQIPRQEKFRLAIVDGFSGAGLYENNEPGSPIIFIETLTKAANDINIYRASQGMRPIKIECLIIINDKDPEVARAVEKNTTPALVMAKEESKNLQITPIYLNQDFEQVFPSIKKTLNEKRYFNVFFNLDQCGYSKVTSGIIKDIMKSWRSAEILLTFMIQSMLAFLSPKTIQKNSPIEAELREILNTIENDHPIGKKEWLGNAEKAAYLYLQDCAAFVSPFSINNPEGWQYWLMHFAGSYRARQVYNDILHQSDAQAHFGRPGLNMLSYDPKSEGQLYLFDIDSRQAAKNSLYDDIPRFLEHRGGKIKMENFYSDAYNQTPAHSQDIHEMIIENVDMEVTTESGGKRRSPNSIKPTDTLNLKTQRSFFFIPNRKN